MAEQINPVIRRLRSIEGHVRGVERMVEEGKYCIDIIHQTQAIKRALDKVEQEILSDHLAHCVTTAMRSDDLTERERVINELMDVFNAKNKL
ncbi:MAG TPA: metal-sensitive transcriptional regulator [Ardenticatenaceae bacterium]|jgi:DNA-binding FrmR family transcriptional regulator